jgi:hypothetical protein
VRKRYLLEAEYILKREGDENDVSHAGKRMRERAIAYTLTSIAISLEELVKLKMIEMGVGEEALK